MKSKLIAICASTRNCVIGLQGTLPVHSPSDMKFFKEKTMNNHVIMGSGTFKSLGYKPLPNRSNTVITRNVDKFTKMDIPKTVYYTDSLYAALKHGSIDRDTYIIGGASIYSAYMSMVDELYLTVFDYNVDDSVLAGCSEITRFPYRHLVENPLDAYQSLGFTSGEVVGAFNDDSTSGTIYHFKRN